MKIYRQVSVKLTLFLARAQSQPNSMILRISGGKSCAVYYTLYILGCAVCTVCTALTMQCGVKFGIQNLDMTPHPPHRETTSGHHFWKVYFSLLDVKTVRKSLTGLHFCG